MKFYRGQDYGCVVDDHGNVTHLWISESRYMKPREDLMSELQMWLAHGEARGNFKVSLDVWAAYDRAAKWNVLEFVAQLPTIGGYIVNIDTDAFKKCLEQKHAV